MRPARPGIKKKLASAFPFDHQSRTSSTKDRLLYDFCFTSKIQQPPRTFFHVFILPAEFQQIELERNRKNQ